MKKQNTLFKFFSPKRPVEPALKSSTTSDASTDLLTTPNAVSTSPFSAVAEAAKGIKNPSFVKAQKPADPKPSLKRKENPVKAKKLDSAPTKKARHQMKVEGRTKEEADDSSSSSSSDSEGDASSSYAEDSDSSASEESSSEAPSSSDDDPMTDDEEEEDVMVKKKTTKKKKKTIAVEENDDMDFGDLGDFDAMMANSNTTSSTPSASHANTATPQSSTNSEMSLAAFDYETFDPATHSEIVNRPPNATAMKWLKNTQKAMALTKPGSRVDLSKLSERELMNRFDGSGEAWWIKPELVRDKNKKRPGEEGYNARTLYVPQAMYKTFTPAQEQYWQVKSENFDVILFFKIGKFYELFDGDAAIGVKELGLNMMSSARPHCGFPEMGFAKYAEQLVEKGYNVGRVEQTETPHELKIRNSKLRKGEKKSKVVNREMCSMLTPATLVDLSLLKHSQATYLFALCEIFETTTDKGVVSTYGVSYIDTSTGVFRFAQFQDDTQRTRLRTLLAQIAPREILLPSHSGLSPQTEKLLRADLPVSVTRRRLEPRTEFWDGQYTLNQLRGYFAENDTDTKKHPFPRTLDANANGSPLALSSIGALVCFLRRLLLDTELVSQGQFELVPLLDVEQDVCTLDGHTLRNLEILENSDGTKKGSVLDYIDHTTTAFGKRQLKEWVCKPLGRTQAINDRLDAVEEIMANMDAVNSLRNGRMKRLKDLERMVSRVCANSIAKNVNAVMYSNVGKGDVIVWIGGRPVLVLELKPRLKHQGQLNQLFLQLHACRESGLDLKEDLYFLGMLVSNGSYIIAQEMPQSGEKLQFVYEVMPVHNEEEGLENVLDRTTLVWKKIFEIIAVRISQEEDGDSASTPLDGDKGEQSESRDFSSSGNSPQDPPRKRKTIITASPVKKRGARNDSGRGRTRSSTATVIEEEHVSVEQFKEERIRAFRRREKHIQALTSRAPLEEITYTNNLFN